MATSDGRFCSVQTKAMTAMDRLFIECLFDEMAANDAYHIGRAVEKVKEEKKKAFFYIALFPVFLPFNFLFNGIRGLKTQFINTKKCFNYLKINTKQHVKGVYNELVQ